MTIIFLLFLTFRKGDHLFRKPELIPLTEKRSLSLTEPQWYFVHYLFEKDINTIKTHLPHIKISSLSFYEDYLALFLTPNEAQLLNSLDNIKVFTRSNTKSTLKTLTRNETFLIQAHSSFKAPQYSDIISQKGPFYLIKTSQPNSIANDPTVLTISQLPLMRIKNRWTTGFLQSGEEKLYIKDGYYTSNRKYNDRNLTGNNVIVTLIDTGADMNNCLFRDPNIPPPFNTTNYNHRKVIRYDPFVDSTDRYAGHGTHCAGIIAGQTYTEKVELYNGHAPGAKLYVADIGKDEQDNINVDLSSIFEIIDTSHELKSPILSCSWGTNVSIPELTTLIDYLAYSDPSQLFVFAAGNDGLKYTVGSPADSKNVLSVAASYPTRPFFNSYSTYSWIKIVKNNKESLNATSLNSYLAFDERKSDFLNNVEIVTFSESTFSEYSQKVVVIPNKDGRNLTDVFDAILKKEAKAAIVFDRNDLSHDELFVMSVPSQFADFFNSTSKVVVDIIIDTVRGFNNATVAPFSSQGPAYFGNRKPDVMAPGFYISSAGGAPFPDECDTTTSIIQMSGTSMATPAVSGTLALIYEYLAERKHKLPASKGTQNVTSSLLRAFSVASAGDKADNAQGFGNINLSRVLVYPELDTNFGLRFRSDELRSGESVSYNITTNSIGDLSVSVAWTDYPLNSKSVVPLFAYFDLFVVDSNGKVHDCEEDFSTTKKVVIKNANPGTYEIRVRSNTIQNIEEGLNYGIVVVGAFDHLNFEVNSNELRPTSTSKCSPLCESNCDFSSLRCECSTDRTGTHCESAVEEIFEGKTVEKPLSNRQFWFTKFDITKHHSMSSNQLQTSAINVECKVKGRSRNDVGMIRYFLNIDNKVRLNIPRYSIAIQEEAVSSFQIPLIDVIRLDAIYFTAFNDVYSDVSISIKWDVVDTRNIIHRFVESKIFKILMIVLIVVFSLTIVGSITAIIVCLVLRKRRRHRKHKSKNKQNSPEPDSLTIPDPKVEMKDSLIENNAEDI